MTVDNLTFPHLSSYLEQLPQGLDSYPGCLVKRDPFEKIATDFPVLARQELPESIASLIAGTSEEWVPEVVGTAAFYAARDVGCESDEEFLLWSYTNSERVFRKPLYRALMRVLSPALVAMGAAKRWGSFHRGSTLIADPVERVGERLHTRVTLRYPERVFGELVVRYQVEAFRAAVKSAGGDGIRVSLDHHDTREATFVIGWAA